MQGQHLLSAVAEILVGAGTLSWEMHPLKDGEAAATSAVSVELDIDQLSSAQVQAIQVCTYPALQPLCIEDIDT